MEWCFSSSSLSRSYWHSLSRYSHLSLSWFLACFASTRALSRSFLTFATSSALAPPGGAIGGCTAKSWPSRSFILSISDLFSSAYLVIYFFWSLIICSWSFSRPSSSLSFLFWFADMFCCTCVRWLCCAKLAFSVYKLSMTFDFLSSSRERDVILSDLA